MSFLNSSLESLRDIAESNLPSSITIILKETVPEANYDTLLIFTYDTIFGAVELITWLNKNWFYFISLGFAWLHTTTHYDFLSQMSSTFRCKAYWVLSHKAAWFVVYCSSQTLIPVWVYVWTLFIVMTSSFRLIATVWADV